MLLRRQHLSLLCSRILAHTFYAWVLRLESVGAIIHGMDITVTLTRDEAVALHNHTEGPLLVSAQDKLQAALDTYVAQPTLNVINVNRGSW